MTRDHELRLKFVDGRAVAFRVFHDLAPVALVPDAPAFAARMQGGEVAQHAGFAQFAVKGVQGGVQGLGGRAAGPIRAPFAPLNRALTEPL